jgi:hypothetical protein
VSGERSLLFEERAQHVVLFGHGSGRSGQLVPLEAALGHASTAAQPAGIDAATLEI